MPVMAAVRLANASTGSLRRHRRAAAPGPGRGGLKSPRGRGRGVESVALDGVPAIVDHLVGHCEPGDVVLVMSNGCAFSIFVSVEIAGHVETLPGVSDPVKCLLA